MLSRDRQRVLGTGFFVTEHLVVTCWHVLDTLGDTERDAICLEVLQSHEKATARLRVEASSPTEVADLALLELTRPLRGPCTPLPLGSSERSADHRFATFGFPRGFDDTGTWARGTLGYATGDGDFRKLLLHGSDIREGFSGGPLFDEQTRRVVGVVRFKTVSEDAREAYATPTEQLLARCPELRASEDCPYRDLASFRESDARFWKGRGRVLDEQLLPRLSRLPRFVEVSGPSGSGKSSLLHAGLIPALRNGTSIPGSQHWDVRAFRPGLAPFSAMDAAGLPAGAGVVERVRAWRVEHPEPGDRLVLVIDQLEDVLLRGSGAEAEEQQRFLQQLSALADEALPVTCVVALREGFDAVLSQRAPKLRSLLGEQRVQVPSVLTPSELRDIIAGPAREVGLRFDPPEVVDSIALAAQEEFRVEAGAGARVTALPLLEVALTQLWQTARDGAIKLEAFNASAGLLGSLARWADGVYEPLKASERRLADRLLLELVQLGEAENGLEDKGRRVPLELLRERLGDPAEVDAVLQALVNGRLLVTAQDGHQQRETVELIHDALLTHWQRFVKLRTEDRAFRRWHEAVQTDAERWRDSERAQQRQEAEDRLLRGAALVRAQQMLSAHPRQASELAQRYVLRSHEAERARHGRARRNLWLALGASVTALVAVGWLYVLRAESEAQAQRARDEAARTANQLFWNLRTTEASAVIGLTRAPGREAEALVRAIQLAGSPLAGHDAARDEVTEALTEATAAFLHAVPLTTEREARTLALFSPDSRHLVTRGILLSPTVRFVSRLWDVRTGSMLHEFESFELCPDSASKTCTEKLHADILGEDTHAFGFAPDDGVLWLGGFHGALTRWNPNSPLPSTIDAHTARVTAVSFSGRGDQVLSASLDGTARLWDARTGQLLRTLTHSEPCTQAVVSADAGYALVGGEQRTCLFKLGSGVSPIQCFNTHDAGPSLAFSPSGQLAALGDSRGEGSVLLVDVHTGRVRRTLSGLAGHALMPSFEDECSLSAFNETFTSALTTRFCDRGPGIAPGGTASSPKQTAWQPIQRVGRFTHDGRRHFAITAEPVTANPFIRVPQSTARWMMRTTPLAEQQAKGLLSPDGRTLLLYDSPGLTRETRDFTTWTHHIPGGIAASPDLRWLVVRSHQAGRISLVDLETGRDTALGDCAVTGARYSRLAEFSRDGAFLAVRCDRQIQFWDMSQWERGPLAQPPPVEAGLSQFAFPRNWHWRLVTSTDSAPGTSVDRLVPGTAYLQKTGGAHERPCQTTRAFTAGSTVEFAPIGTHFAVFEAGSVYLGSTIDCRLVQEAPLATGRIGAIRAAFSPNGLRFVTLSADRNVSALWDGTTGKRLAELPESFGAAVMAFSHDSKYFVITNDPDLDWMGKPFLFDATDGTPLRLAPIDGKVKALSFSPDGSRLIAVTDAAVHLLDPRTGALVRSIDWRSHLSVKIHHADHRFGVTDASGRSQFWRTKDGQSVGALHRARRITWDDPELQSDAEGERILTIDTDGAYLFSLKPNDLLQTACSLVRGRSDATQVQALCDTFRPPAAPLAGAPTP
ncbi:High-affnity carbon uptake protein Hat/HatR [Myxococcus hansupus]|uniref:High-affnity carbon uptake protein Hat/HatR n=1 Tax=Pseudomyxococcus hansupus TaxID=1297742 RepID=A0A0H4WT99_9BACT|nr:trypsin-like peptidase domain-containing protein [Myxococcus hansupus]AKQ64545.1 High-affnity carbon uptake protein Hat/HatR [Myxococcus hansupus]